jgi:hypothetical protein
MLLHTVPAPPEPKEEQEENKKEAPIIEGTAEDLEKLFKDFKV